jgi:hypothetical protein
MKNKNISFDLFRYQILPINRSFHPDLFEEIISLDDLLAKKNQIFFKALLNVCKFETRKTIIRHKVLYEDQNQILYRFAANRSLTRETEEFTEEEVENWPSFLVYIWNDPLEQFIAIQERWSAFQKTEIVAKSITEAVNEELGKNNLRARPESLFLESEFWDLIEQNTGKIRDVLFELITPNMSNICETLSDDLKDLAKSTNTTQTNLNIQADPDSSIVLDPNDKNLKGLVSYSSEGGGNISIKVRGLSKRIHTKKSKKHIDLTELEIEGKDSSEIAAIIKDLLS